MNLSSRYFYFLFVITSIITSLVLYKSSLNYFFFQDDFFEINISEANNFSQYLNFYKFRGDIIAYRPISLQNYFYISGVLFSLNATGFRIITFSLFFLSFFLITRVIKKITHDKRIGFLAGFLWITSSIHFMALTWIAAAYNIIGTFFWLLTSVIFLNYLKNHNIWFYILSIVVFFLTIGSFEFSITWPVIFGFYYFFVKKNTFLKSLIIFSPFIILTLIYLILRMSLVNVPDILEYRFTFNVDSVKALFWYFLWSFNIPEEFKKQVINNLILFNSKFLLDFWPLVAKTFIGALWIIFLGLVLPLYNILNKKKLLNLRLVVFAIFWFLIGISPVLLLPNHTFSMYLTLSAIGIYFLVSYLIIESHRKILIIPIILIWLFTSGTTLSFYKVNSWMVNAQKTAYDAKVNLKRSFPQLPSNSALLYPVNSHWEKQALSGNNFVRTIYNDQSLRIYYNKYDLIRDFKKGLNLPINIYIPK